MTSLDGVLRAFLPLRRDGETDAELVDAIEIILASPKDVRRLTPLPAPPPRRRTRFGPAGEDRIGKEIAFLERSGATPSRMQLEAYPGDARFIPWIEQFWTARSGPDRPPVTAVWGDLAWRSGLDFTTMSRWLERGRPLSLVALHAWAISNGDAARGHPKAEVDAFLKSAADAAPPLLSRALSTIAKRLR